MILSNVTSFIKRKVSGADTGFIVPLWLPHIHAIVANGVFTETGHIVRIPDTWKHRAIDIQRDRVFDLLLDEK